MLKGHKVLRRETVSNLSLFSSSETEMLITKILGKKMLLEADSVEINLCDWFHNDKRELDDTEIVDALYCPPSQENPGLVLKLFGSQEATMGSSWTFEACQMRPEAASQFLYEYLTIPLIRLNHLMCQREATLIDHSDRLKKQLHFSENLYRSEMKRAPPKLVDVQFDMERFQSWDHVDWKTVASFKNLDLKSNNGSASTDGFASESLGSVLPRIDMFTRERRAAESLQREKEKRKQEDRISTLTSPASHESATVNVESQTLAEQQNIRRLKREAELERAKQKQQKKSKMKF